MANPSVRQLDIFAHMAAAGSIARGAADLRLGPAEVEAGIASLEMRLGYRLFDRSGDSLRLTAAGRKTAQAMALLSMDEEEEPSAAAPPPVLAPLPVRVAALDVDVDVDWDTARPAGAPPPPLPPTPRTSILLAAPAAVFGHFQDALAAFEAANEDVAITLDLKDHLAADAALALGRGTADIVYFYALGKPALPESRYGWSEQINLYAGAVHPLARAPMVTREMLCDELMLAMEPGNPLRRLTGEGLDRAGIRVGPLGLETDDMFEIMAALREGMGYFAAFGPLARDLGKMEGIGRLALDVPLPSVEIRQAVSDEAGDKAAIGALAEYLFL